MISSFPFRLSSLTWLFFACRCRGLRLRVRRVSISLLVFLRADFFRRSSCRFYNSTRYSGLETHIANSYTNSILQALHYTLPFRTVAKSHLSTPCPKEHCLLCEAGFLFRMLEDAQGTNCQASNFSRAFAGTSQGEICFRAPSSHFASDINRLLFFQPSLSDSTIRKTQLLPKPTLLSSRTSLASSSNRCRSKRTPTLRTHGSLGIDRLLPSPSHRPSPKFVDLSFSRRTPASLVGGGLLEDRRFTPSSSSTLGRSARFYLLPPPPPRLTDSLHAFLRPSRTKLPSPKTSLPSSTPPSLEMSPPRSSASPASSTLLFELDASSQKARSSLPSSPSTPPFTLPSISRTSGSRRLRLEARSLSSSCL